MLLVDDEPRLRAQLGAVLADYGVVIMGEAGTGREGVELARRLRPDVVLMDLRMPEMDGIAATRELSEVLPSTPVIVLSAYEDPALLREARQAGAAPTWSRAVGPACWSTRSPRWLSMASVLSR